MKKAWSFAALAFAIIVMLSTAEPASALSSPRMKAPKAFQAQFTLQQGTNPPQQGTMYFSHGRIREEISPAGGGPKSVTIIDAVSKTIYLLDPDQKSFKILPWDPRAALVSEALKRSGKKKLVETKTVDGQECQNFEIVPKDPGMKPYNVWVNKSTRYPVELTSADSDPAKAVDIKWSNLSPGYQAAILFGPPLGYHEMK